MCALKAIWALQKNHEVNVYNIINVFMPSLHFAMKITLTVEITYLQLVPKRSPYGYLDWVPLHLHWFDQQVPSIWKSFVSPITSWMWRTVNQTCMNLQSVDVENCHEHFWYKSSKHLFSFVLAHIGVFTEHAYWTCTWYGIS